LGEVAVDDVEERELVVGGGHGGGGTDWWLDRRHCIKQEQKTE
jgi:hypothetical protein